MFKFKFADEVVVGDRVQVPFMGDRVVFGIDKVWITVQAVKIVGRFVEVVSGSGKTYKLYRNDRVKF